MQRGQQNMKHAVVTGAGSGIGERCALDLLERGWRVFGMDRSLEALERIGRGQGSAKSGNFIPICCDVSSAAEVAGAFEAVSSQSGGLDALICSAGLLKPGFLTDMDEADFDTLFAVNAKGSWLCARSAVPLLERRASPSDPSRIILVGSVSALRPKVKGGAYAASKIAVTYIGRVLAAELAQKQILVNIVAPATVDTPMTRALKDRPDYKLSGVSPLGRVAEPSDVAGVIHFLLSPAATYISGAVIPVDGATSAAFVS